MRRILTIGTVALALVIWALPAGASVRGGWATTTPDAIPDPEPGQTLEVGFTILQHGRTPVDVADVFVVVHDGASDQRWPAVHDGPVGHYVAEVTFPDDTGSFDWSVEQGWFGEFPLGTLHIGEGGGDGSTAAGGSTWSQISWPWRLALPLPILGSVALFFLDRRRHRSPGAVTPVTTANA